MFQKLKDLAECEQDESAEECLRRVYDALIVSWNDQVRTNDAINTAVTSNLLFTFRQNGAQIFSPKLRVSVSCFHFLPTSWLHWSPH